MKNSLKSSYFINTAIFLTVWLLLSIISATPVHAGSDGVVIGRLKYGGGGDWYNDPEIIPNLLRKAKEVLGIRTSGKQVIVSIEDEKLFELPFIFMTGHGNISFTESELSILRRYLEGGGFLYADDDYGMDQAFRREMKKLFPEKELVEVPFSHPIYRFPFEFPKGVPKIHEHEPGPPSAWGIFHEGRLVVYYTYNSNISDGWADPATHNDPAEIREEALKMGINILYYALTH